MLLSVALFSCSTCISVCVVYLFPLKYLLCILVYLITLLGSQHGHICVNVFGQNMFQKRGGKGHATVLSDECVLRLAELGRGTVHGIDSVFCCRRRLRRRRWRSTMNTLTLAVTGAAHATSCAATCLNFLNTSNQRSISRFVPSYSLNLFLSSVSLAAVHACWIVIGFCLFHGLCGCREFGGLFIVVVVFLYIMYAITSVLYISYV